MSHMSTFKEITLGLGYAMKGMRLFAKNPRLWLLAIIPAILNIAIAVFMIYLLIHHFGEIYAWISAHIETVGLKNPSTWYAHIVSAILWIINALFQTIVFVVALIITLIFSYALGIVISSPFLDAISERVESILLEGNSEKLSLKEIIFNSIRTLKIEILKAIVMVAIPIFLFTMNLIPIVGGVLYIALTLTLGCWDLGFSFADIPNARRASPFRLRWRFAMKNKWLLMGFGLPFVIPFFSLIFSAPLTVGGTMIYIDRKDTKDER